MARVGDMYGFPLYSRLIVCMRVGGEAGQLRSLTRRLPCADPGDSESKGARGV